MKPQLATYCGSGPSLVAAAPSRRGVLAKAKNRQRPNRVQEVRPTVPSGRG
jgi:hypothetical protein